MGYLCIDDSRIATVHPRNINPRGSHQVFIMGGPCDHGRSHDGNGNSMLSGGK